MPIGNAMVTITDAKGVQVMRNGLFVLRHSDDAGLVTIPAVEADYITISSRNYLTLTISAADNSKDIVLEKKGMFAGKKTIFFTDPIMDTLVIVGVPLLLCIGIYFFTKLKK